MPPISRKHFFEKLLVTDRSDGDHSSGDAIFNKYANKELPASKATMSLSLDQYTGVWTQVQIKHLINRTMFGARQQDIDSLSVMAMPDAVDLLLAPAASAPLPPVNNYTDTGDVDATGVAFGETWTGSSYGDANLNFARIDSFKAWWIGQMIHQDISIIEKMIFFWHNHFATQTLVVEDARFSYNYQQLLRNNVLGNFKSLVKGVTVDTAMLSYLNGSVNTKNNPDENYARELQELFTMGKGNVPNYDEEDVKSAAKVLTGWNINSSSFTSYFLPQLHDISDKKFSSFFNNTIITGHAGVDGASETDELINMIFDKKSEVAHFLCTKLYRFFVYYNITAEIDANIIYPLAQTLIANNFEIRPVLTQLFKSQHFYDANNAGCYIKTPLDLFVGCFRAFAVDVTGSGSISGAYKLWHSIDRYATVNGLSLGDPPNVGGWPAFYESPVFSQVWINSSTLPARMSFTDAVLMNGIDIGTGTPVIIDVLKFAKECPDVSDAQLLINWMAGLLLGIDITADEKDRMKEILLSGQANAGYWTVAWSAYIADPNDMNTNIVQSRLRSLLVELLRLPEFQLC